MEICPAPAQCTWLYCRTEFVHTLHLIMLHRLISPAGTRRRIALLQVVAHLPDTSYETRAGQCSFSGSKTSTSSLSSPSRRKASKIRSNCRMSSRSTCRNMRCRFPLTKETIRMSTLFYANTRTRGHLSKDIPDMNIESLATRKLHWMTGHSCLFSIVIPTSNIEDCPLSLSVNATFYALFHVG
jgi:hypothetical protein